MLNWLPNQDTPSPTKLSLICDESNAPNYSTLFWIRLSDLAEPVRSARRCIEVTPALRLTADQSYAAKIVVSELATNAFRHGLPPIELALHTTEEGKLIIEVSDADPTPPISRLPSERGGFGIGVVSAYANITVIQTEIGKSVLAQLISNP